MSRGEPLNRQWKLLKAMLSPRTLAYFTTLDEALSPKALAQNVYEKSRKPSFRLIKGVWIRKNTLRT